MIFFEHREPRADQTWWISGTCCWETLQEFLAQYFCKAPDLDLACRHGNSKISRLLASEFLPDLQTSLANDGESGMVLQFRNS